MPIIRRFAAPVAAIILILSPATALGQSAGDQQYADPFGNNEQNQSGGGGSGGGSGGGTPIVSLPSVGSVGGTTAAAGGAVSGAGSKVPSAPVSPVLEPPSVPTVTVPSTDGSGPLP